MMAQLPAGRWYDFCIFSRSVNGISTQLARRPNIYYLVDQVCTGMSTARRFILTFFSAGKGVDE